MTAVTRFAPSPNGHLHVGHALSAIIAYDAARKDGGRFLLRIEDIDLERRRPEFVDAIYEDLAWLGLAWEEPVLVQSEHFAEYLKAADKLIAMGLLYPCFATRAEIAAAADPANDRSGRCAALSGALERRASGRRLGADGSRRGACAETLHGRGAEGAGEKAR